ncbi:uncharacterized protein LOC106870490 [Octopus bimaculoides]|uniref:4-nitrophenylphosphatase n=1 Tax=Octopus bimaculoides TaxID=37653 RepID=A0A0L8HIF9_OCTBM|nr:uncharacterized protein LOC106870490 [Octopus bimaculoides]|eukprot:XP_014772089.1 PREDICTED: phosphoglycolate phosphatase 2-like [Octopus bimaculoides]
MVFKLTRTVYHTWTKLTPRVLLTDGIRQSSVDARRKLSSNCYHLDCSSAKRIVDKYDTILLDCDGVIWGTDHVSRMDKVNEALYKLRQHGKQLLFVTNNSLYSTNTFFDKFVQYGFDINHDEIFCITSATAFYLKSVLGVKKSVYVIGSEAMGTELQNLKIDHFGIGPEPDSTSRKIDDLLDMHFRDDVEAVLVGFDEYLCYNKLYKASSYLQDPDCHFVVTSDVEMGTKIGPNRYRPSVGTVVGAVSAAAYPRKYTVVGKPSSFLYKFIKLKFPELNLNKIITIGDSLRSDVKFAKNIGSDSALVLSGASDMQTLLNTLDMDKPNYYFQNLALFAEVL